MFLEKMKLLVMLFVVGGCGEVMEVDYKVVSRIFDYSQPALLLLHDGGLESKLAIKALQAYGEGTSVTQGDEQTQVLLAETNRNDLRTSMRSTDDHYQDPHNFNFFKRLTSFMGLNPDRTPNLLYIHYPHFKFQYQEIFFTEKSIAEFLRRAHEGQLHPHFKSQPIPNRQSTVIVEDVVGLNFQERVIRAPCTVLVMFYAPWCGLCIAAKSLFQKAAMQAKVKGIRFVRIDATANEVEQVKIFNYPTLYLWSPRLKQPILFDNYPRTAAQISDWLNRVEDTKLLG